MTTTFSPDVCETITTICNREGFDIIEYSGRGMYGATCLGITLPSIADIAVFFTCLAVDNSAVAFDLAPATRTDDMGRDIVIYWERVAFTGFTESDEEGECDDCGDSYALGADDHCSEEGKCFDCCTCDVVTSIVVTSTLV